VGTSVPVVDRQYMKGYAFNLGIMAVGFAVAVLWILLVVSLGLSHQVGEILASLSVVPLFGGILISNVRIFREARRQPSAMAYRRLPLRLRLLPPLLLVGGIAGAKLLKVNSGPTVSVHVMAWTGLLAGVGTTFYLRRRSKQL
jgi:hypothetical protein